MTCCAVLGQHAGERRDLSRSALEALAIDAYRMRLTSHQVCQLLDIASRDELDRFLKHHGVPLEYTLEDLDREGASARLWQKHIGERDRSSDRQPE
jgi:hypothetical protein